MGCYILNCKVEREAKMNAREERRVMSRCGYGTLLLVLLLMSSGIALADDVGVDCDLPGDPVPDNNLQAAIDVVGALYL